MTYKIVSKISYAIRFYICFITIEAVPIFKSDLVGLIAGQVFPTYGILMLISYAIVGIIYERGSAPVFGVISYFVMYIPLALLLWGVLLSLTFLKILPI